MARMRVDVVARRALDDADIRLRLGAVVESDRRAYYTAGGRVWVLDLEPSAGKKPRLKQPA